MTFIMTACGPAPIHLSHGPQSFTAKDYKRVYRAWTRSDEYFKYGELTDTLHATATYESHPFRWAYVTRYASDHYLTETQRTDMLNATLEDSKVHHRFFVTVAGRDFRQTSLTDTQSAWRVLLVNADTQEIIEPEGIKHIRNPSAVHQSYYPSINNFRQAFHVDFPAKRADGSDNIPLDCSKLILRLTGALGTLDLEWKFTSNQSSLPNKETSH